MINHWCRHRRCAAVMTGNLLDSHESTGAIVMQPYIALDGHPILGQFQSTPPANRLRRPSRGFLLISDVGHSVLGGILPSKTITPTHGVR